MTSRPILALAVAMVSIATTVVADDDKKTIEDSVVRVLADQRTPNWLRPWVKYQPRSVSGSGMVIAGNRILTNSHVVMHATQVYVQPHGSSDKLEATVERISPEFDLAVLKLEDEKFFKGRKALAFAEKVPKVRDAVTTYGYQSGGLGLSTTKGTISRIEYGRYSYGEMGLRLEITAPIKSGNSGGPAISNGKIVGVVFAVSARGNIGHAIAAEEVQRFLKAPKSTREFGKLTFMQSLFTLENKAQRAKLKIPDETTGVLVGTIRSKKADYPLKAGDVITHIGNYNIDNTGLVKIYDTQLSFMYLVQKLKKDRKVPLTVYRGGKTVKIKLPLERSNEVSLIQALKGGTPSYFVWGPLAFTPATAELVALMQRYLGTTWANGKSPLLFRRADRPAFQGEELVVVVTMFRHKLVKGYSAPVGRVVKSVNGVRIKNLRHLIETLRDATGRFVEFKFHARGSQTLVFERKDVLKATDQILTDNGIRLQASPRELIKLWETKPKKTAYQINSEFAGKLIAVLDDYATALESVKDKATARKAALKIDLTTETMEELFEQRDQVPKVSKDEKAKLNRLYNPKLKKASQRLTKAAFSAGKSCERDESFLKAIKRMQKIAELLKEAK